MIFFGKKNKNKINFMDEKGHFPPNATNGALTLPMIINLIKEEDFTTTGTQTYALKTSFLICLLLLKPFQPNSSKKNKVILNLDDDERLGNH